MYPFKKKKKCRVSKATTEGIWAKRKFNLSLENHFEGGFLKFNFKSSSGFISGIECQWPISTHRPSALKRYLPAFVKISMVNSWLLN